MYSWGIQLRKRIELYHTMHLLGLAFIFVVISLHVNFGLAYSLPRSNKAGIILTLFPFVVYNLI